MKDKSDAADASTPSKTPRGARRRLMGGAFAVPVALTLRSGGAAAASFSCVYKQNQSPVFQPNVAQDDGWLRVQLWRLTGQNANFSSTWISGAEIVANAKPGKTTFLSGTEWWCMSAGGNAKIQTGISETAVVAGQKYSPSPTPPQYRNGSNLYVAVAQPIWVAIRVDASGNIVGIVGDGKTTTNSSSVSDSCWSSFAG